MLFFSSFIVALVVTMALIPPLMRLAERLSVVDVPDERKVHSHAIPRIGGIAMVLGAIFPVMLWATLDRTMVSFLAALAVLLFFGAWDDSRDLDYRIKFFGQFVAVLLVVLIGDVKFAIFPFAGMEPVPELLSVPVTILFLVGTTNAVNLSDGLDGLAAGVSLLSLSAIALLAYFGDGQNIMLICFAVAGAIFGFLRYNTFPARLFMGDTGSQFLGFTVGVLSIVLTQKSNTALNPVIPLFLVGLPIIDTLFVMGQRYREGRSLFAADRNHIHHRLLALGMKHYEAVAAIYLTQLVFVLLAVVLRYESDALVLTGYVLFSALLLAVLVVARERQWNVKQTSLTRYVGRLNHSEQAHRFALRLIECGVAAYLLYCAVAVKVVPMDIRISALVLFLVLLMRLAWSGRLRFVPLRLLIFPAIAFVVYLAHMDARARQWVPDEFRVVLLAGLLGLMLFAIRYTRNESFRTTPTDLLVIAMAGGVGVLYERGMVDMALAPVMVGIVALFYAAEMVMRQMSSIWNCLTIGIAAVLGVLALGLL